MPSARRIPSARRPLAAVLSAVVLFAALTGGVCLCRVDAGAGTAPCIVSLDVCGAGAQAVQAGAADAASMPATLHELYLPAVSFIPPSPAQAVASAEPGDAEKPPQA